MNQKELLLQSLSGANRSHAYLLLGGDVQQWQEIFDEVKNTLDIHPADWSLLEPETEEKDIKIEFARELIHWSYLSPSGSLRVAAIFNCEMLNKASSNYLLKSLEEPPSRVIFLLFAKNDSVLPTIRSRCRILRLSGLVNSEINQEISTMLQGSFVMASKEFEKLSKEPGQVEVWIKSLENHFRARLLTEKSIRLVSDLKAISQARKQIKANVNSRLVLENLFLILSKV